MLGSITPLGERGRGARWEVTAAAFAAGAVAAGAAVGASLGAAGAALDAFAAVPEPARLAALGAVIAAGLALESGLAGVRLPAARRQVSEDWLVRYRPWVYGAGFGVQLGAGFLTVVNSAATNSFVLRSSSCTVPIACPPPRPGDRPGA